MRTFNPVEQEVIKKLKYYYDNGIYQNLLSLLDNDLENKEIVRDLTTNSVSINFDTTVYYPENDDEAYNFINEVTVISRVLIQTIFLLQYLESTGYIFMYDEGSSINSHSRISDGHTKIKYDIGDKTVCKLINEYFSKTIVISQDIVDLVNDNFISKEEIRHIENLRVANENLAEAKAAVLQSQISNNQAQQGLKLAADSIKIATDDLAESKKSVGLSRIGIWTAIITGGLSLIISTFSIVVSYQTSNQPTKIDSNQFQKAEKMMNSVIDNQKATKNKLDTMSTYIRKIKK